MMCYWFNGQIRWITQYSSSSSSSSSSSPDWSEWSGLHQVITRITEDRCWPQVWTGPVRLNLLSEVFTWIGAAEWNRLWMETKLNLQCCGCDDVCSLRGALAALKPSLLLSCVWFSDTFMHKGEPGDCDPLKSLTAALCGVTPTFWDNRVLKLSSRPRWVFWLSSILTALYFRLIDQLQH